ncbi:MAG: phosphoribosylglycinamide formyltransferase [Planctomycetota bacterium]
MSDSGYPFSVPTPTAVLISGGGRTLLNLQAEIDAGRLAVRIVQVITSSSKAAGNERATAIGLPVEVIPRGTCPDDATFSQRVFECVTSAGAELVCLAGYLKFLPIPDHWLGRVINIHPALLPDFGGQGMYGERVHRAVLAAGATESGCTVHFADNEYDHGPVIVQQRCRVEPGETADTLAQRVFACECEAYPEAIRRLQRGQVVYRPESGHAGAADLQGRDDR